MKIRLGTADRRMALGFLALAERQIQSAREALLETVDNPVDPIRITARLDDVARSCEEAAAIVTAVKKAGSDAKETNNQARGEEG